MLACSGFFPRSESTVLGGSVQRPQFQSNSDGRGSGGRRKRARWKGRGADGSRGRVHVYMMFCGPGSRFQCGVAGGGLRIICGPVTDNPATTRREPRWSSYYNCRRGGVSTSVAGLGSKAAGRVTYADGYTQRSEKIGMQGSPSVAGRRIRRLQRGRSGPVVEGRDSAVPRYRADIKAGGAKVALAKGEFCGDSQGEQARGGERLTGVGAPGSSRGRSASGRGRGRSRRRPGGPDFRWGASKVRRKGVWW